MAKLERPLTFEDFPFLVTMYETLELVITHCEEAQNAQTSGNLELHLKMASRAMRCALEIYRDNLEMELKK